jgi:hypothetical protein
MDSLSNIQGQAMDQVSRISSIPMRVLNNWPAWFSISLVNYAAGMVLAAVPRAGGMAGTVLDAAVNGAAQTITMVTWEAVRQ